MNEQERAEVESLKRRQNELLRETTTLAEQLRGKEMMIEGVRRDLQRLWTSHGALEMQRRKLADEISSCEAALLARAAVPTVGEHSAATAEAEPSRQERRASAVPPPIPAIPPVIPTTTSAPRTAPPLSESGRSALTPALSPSRGEGEEPAYSDAIATDRPLSPALSPVDEEGEQA